MLVSAWAFSCLAGGSGAGRGVRGFRLVNGFGFGKRTGRGGLVNGSGGFQNGLKLGVNHLVFGFLRFIGNVLRYWRRWWIIRGFCNINSNYNPVNDLIRL